MKTLSAVKAALGGGAAILAAGLLAAPAAHASTGVTVPCKTPALIAAISAANSSGGARINLAPGCTYHLTAANNSPDPRAGRARPGRPGRFPCSLRFARRRRSPALSLRPRHGYPAALHRGLPADIHMPAREFPVPQ
jgi:hypothetical protein